MARKQRPGGLDVVPSGVSEAFLLQEALRYREALIRIEGMLYAPGVSPATRCMSVLGTASQALNDGEEAAGA